MVMAAAVMVLGEEKLSKSSVKTTWDREVRARVMKREQIMARKTERVITPARRISKGDIRLTG